MAVRQILSTDIGDGYIVYIDQIDDWYFLAISHNDEERVLIQTESLSEVIERYKAWLDEYVRTII